MRNQVMRHAFEALPQTVLGTPLGRMVFRTLQRQDNNRKTNNHRKHGGKR